jgi:uncharacterized protein
MFQGRMPRVQAGAQLRGLARGMLALEAVALATLLAACSLTAPPVAPPQPPTSAQSVEQEMRAAEADLARGNAEQAWRRVARLSEPGTPAGAIAYLDLKRRAAFAARRPLDGVQAEVAQERFLTPEEREEARKSLLTELADASANGVAMDASAARDPTVRGWLALGPIVAEAARSPVSAAAAIAAWRARYPEHPAAALVSPELLGAGAPPAAGPHIALLLPLTGRQASAAATVRDGFLTAYYVSSGGERPRIRIYDTGEAGVAEVVERATHSGANFIVGPLTREEVIAAAALPDSRPPMLALNFLPAGRAAPPGFYQFALSPEDEARAAARRVLADGHRHGVALVPDGDWGTRVLAAFSQELTSGGGALIDTARFDPGLIDYAPAVTRVLGIDQSNARFDLVKSIVGGKLDFQPRRRGDIDFIFEASSAPDARLLRPQIRFYFAGDIPAYATSDAFEPDPNANQDLDGLDFPEMPWTLGSGLADSVRVAARSAWPVGGPPRDRLFAFGFDAYRLLIALRSAPPGGAISVEGLTGQLSLDSDGRVRRELEWAQLRDGEPHPLAPPEQSPTPPSVQPGAAPAAPSVQPGAAPPAPSAQPRAAPSAPSLPGGHR